MTKIPFEISRPDVVLYHDNCDDGFTAAHICRSKWGDDPTYWPVQYGQKPFQNIEPEVFDGAKVLIVDFSYSLEQLEQIAQRAQSVVILDHHKTAASTLKHLPTFDEGPISSTVWPDNVRVLFDMDRSGAMLAWDCLFGGDAPQLVKYVQDRDLWRHELPMTKAVNSYVRSFSRTFENWNEIAKAIDEKPVEVVSEGKAILRKHQMHVDEICMTCSKGVVAGHTVPMVACPYAFVSDVGNTLLGMYPDAPFAACVVYSYAGTTVSLRSMDGRMDVSEIAALFDGGGHRNAAGFRAASHIWTFENYRPKHWPDGADAPADSPEFIADGNGTHRNDS